MKKKFRRQGIVVLMCLLTTSLLVGCKVMDDQQREDRLKELLRDKYGEEFEVREMFVTARVEAWCYPVDNPEIIFKIITASEMEVISMDYYIQRSVSAQIEKEIQPKLEEVFPGSYVFVEIPTATTSKDFVDQNEEINAKLLLDYYRSQSLSDSLYISVFFNKENISYEEESYEWTKLNAILGDVMSETGNSNIHFTLYPCEPEDIEEAKKVINEYGWDDIGSTKVTDIYDIVKEKKCMYIFCTYNSNEDKYEYYIFDDENKRELSNEIYVEEREELIK